MCDIDHFKQVNDEHGHRVGDEVIARVAAAVKGCTRTSDIVARYGGEEFVCVIANADHAGLALLAERICRSVEQLNLPDLPWVTISVGFSLQEKEDTSCWDIVERADRALYRAKAGGRNRVEGDALTFDEIITLVEIERRRR